MRDWHHRITDEEFDRELEAWFTNELVEQADSVKRPMYSSDHSIGSAARSATMPNGDSSTGTAAAVGEQTKENLKPSFPEARDGALSHQSIDFDNPVFHKQDEQNGALETALSDPPIETKQEVVATAVTTPFTSDDLHKAHFDTDLSYGSHPLQRVISEPLNNSSTNWPSDNSDGSPVPHFVHNPTSGVHQARPFATLHKSYAQNQSSDVRARAQTYHGGPISYARPNYASLPPSSLNSVTCWDHIEPDSIRFSGAMPDANYAMVSDGLIHPVEEQFDNYNAGFYTGTHNHLSGFNAAGGVINNHRVNRYSIQHNNDDSPLSANSHVDLRDTHQDLGASQYSRIPHQAILKSQHLPISSDARIDGHSVEWKPRGSLSGQPHQDYMAERKGTTTAPPLELHYNDIEAARQAERPRFKTNAKRDRTIPHDDHEKQNYVSRMVRCMKNCKHAEDNEGMINQWEKLKQDEPRLEQAAWRLLVHVDGIPMLPNRPSCNRYASMLERWEAICAGLSSQKTMCKHLLGAEFAAQLVNDPTTATQRVQNNRKVNAGKKSYIDQGRRAAHGEVAKSGRRGSSTSTQLRAEDSDYGGHSYGDAHNGIDPASHVGGMGDEDAEGDIDDEYPNTTGPMGIDHLTADSPKPTTARRPKRELDLDDFDEYRSRAKKPRHLTTKVHPTAPKRHIKNPRRPGERSKFQVVDGKMIELEDKRNEDLVYTRGTAHIQELYTKIHYPNGQPPFRNGRYVNGHASPASGYYPNAQSSSASSSRRVSRAAAPTSFVGQDNSSEGDDPYSDNKNEGMDEYHQVVDHQRS
ncbi:MAG: hypothetical protein Q9178_001978 [Gyalolechia marmorata]